MEILSLDNKRFKQYGYVLEGYDFTQIISELEKTSKKPLDSVVYVPEAESLMKLEVHDFLRDNAFGGMDIQLGYCNGNNKALNCLEYHRGSEVNIVADDILLLLAPLQEVDENYKLDTSKVEAFLVPKGTGVLIYETTLHYAPCTAGDNHGFRVVIALPKGTNTDKPNVQIKNLEDKLLWAKNKWLIAHPDSSEAKQGAFIGLVGENITI